MLLTLKSTLDHIGSNAIGYLKSYWIASWIQKHVKCFYVRICVIFKADDRFIAFFCFFPTISSLIVCISIPFSNFVIECAPKFYQRMRLQILSANPLNKMSCQPKDTRYGWCKWLQECTCFHFYQYSEQGSVNMNRFYLAWSVLQSGKYCTTKVWNYKFAAVWWIRLYSQVWLTLLWKNHFFTIWK